MYIYVSSPSSCSVLQDEDLVFYLRRGAVEWITGDLRLVSSTSGVFNVSLIVC